MFNFLKKIFKKKSNIEKYDSGKLTIEQWNKKFNSPEDRLNIIFHDDVFLEKCFKNHVHRCINSYTKITYDFYLTIEQIKNQFNISYSTIYTYFYGLQTMQLCGKSFIFKGLYQSQSHLHSDYLVFEKIKE